MPDTDSKREKEVYHLPMGTYLKKRYRIDGVLGQGGYGIVYKAVDTSLNRIVAIKECFPTAYLNRKENGIDVFVFNERNRKIFNLIKYEFLGEARNITAFNSHPNIIHVFDYFEENGTAYFVMEYLDGYSLKEVLEIFRKQGKTMTVDRAIEIEQSLLAALKTAHGVGILHRDVKPGNIMLLKDGSIKLFDFGSARFSDVNDEKTRTVVITPGYAPPEQYQHKSRQGPFTDIYAAGAVLYEMLTGKKPDESVNRKLKDMLIPPLKVNARVSENVSNACMRALALQPEIRFQSADQFIEALQKKKGKVRDAKEQLRNRKQKRNAVVFGLGAVAAVLVILSVFNFSKGAVKRNLTAEVEIWLPVYGSLSVGETEKLFALCLEEFEENNREVKTSIRCFEKEEYYEVLKDALMQGRGPDLFESTDLDLGEYEAVVGKTFDPAWFMEDECLFLWDDSDMVSKGKSIPLTFDLPVLYQNSIEESLPDSKDYSGFLNGSSDYLGQAADLVQVQEDMAGIYSVYQGIVPNTKGSYRNCFSMNEAGTEEEKQAAARIIYYFLQQKAQEKLTLENSGHIPLNREIFNIYTQINSDFAYLSDAVNELKLEKTE